jgi:tRNA threonylcarbamoyladenosine biosynthesis protein TsaE
VASDWCTVTSGPLQTRALGRELGRRAWPGLVVLLAGDLGTGKTCFAQGVADGLGTPADSPVTSPSYTLLNIHSGRLPLYHFDLYRLARVEDLEDLGYDEIAEGDGVTLVEWADRLAMPLPASLSVLLLRLDAQHRELHFTAGDAAGRELLTALTAAANTL